MTSLSNLTYGKVVGRFLALVGDGSDEDPNPDVLPLSGSITFTPTVKSVLVASARPDPATIIPKTIVAVLDSDGYLTYRGERGVALLATDDPSVNPTGFTYTVAFQLNLSGSSIPYASFSINVPQWFPPFGDEPDQTIVDLTLVAPVASANGVPMLRGEPGLDGAPGRDGVDGAPGADGADGVTAAQILTEMQTQGGPIHEWLAGEFATPSAIQTPGSPANQAVLAVAGSANNLTALEAAAKVGEGWFAKVTSPPAANDTPVVTFVPVADTTLPTGTIVKPKRLSTDSSTVDKAGDPAFFYSGTPKLTANALDGSNYVISDWMPTSDAQPDNRFYVIRAHFLTEATSVVEIRTKVGATQGGFRIWVEGKWLTLAAQRFTGLTANGEYRVVLTFPTARARWITFESASRTTTFGGVVVPAGQTVTRYVKPTGIKLAVLGDSFVGGAGQPTDGAGFIESYPNFLARLMDVKDFMNYGYGGSGYVDTHGLYSTRVADILAFAPDVLIISGTRNNGANPSTLGPAVASLLGMLSSVPVIYVTGPSTSTFSATNETVRAATLKAGRVFLDGIAQQWITNADIGVADNIHPTFEGHKKIAKGLYSNIGQVALAAAAAPVAVGDPTTTVLTSSASPTQGAAVTLTATVTPSAAAGTVEFRDGATVLGTSSLTGGVATLVTTALLAGARALTARFIPSNLLYATSTGILSITVLAPSMLSAGSLAYWQGSAQPTGLPANNENVPNLAQTQAAALIGSGDTTTLGFNHVVSGEAAGVLVRERTPKGGYHVVTSQTNPLNTDSASAVSAGIDLKTLINTYMVSNPTHVFAFSAWIRETRVQSGTPVRVTQQIAALSSPSANYLTLMGQNPRPLSSDAKRLAYRETGAVTDLQPVSQAMVVDGFTGTVPTAGNLRASLAIWGNKGGLNTVAPRGASPSFVLYEFVLEDLSVAGAHTMADFLAIDLARFNEAFGAGGRYAGDTVMDVATVQ